MREQSRNHHQQYATAPMVGNATHAHHLHRLPVAVTVAEVVVPAIVVVAIVVAVPVPIPIAVPIAIAIVIAIVIPGLLIPRRHTVAVVVWLSLPEPRNP